MGLVQRLIQPLVTPLALRAAFNQFIQPRIIQQRLRDAAAQSGKTVQLGQHVPKTVELLNRRLLLKDSPIQDYVQVNEIGERALRVYRNTAGEAVAVSSWRRGLLGQERERLLMVADQRRKPTPIERFWFGVNRNQTVEPQWRIRQKASFANVWDQMRGGTGAPRWGFRALPFEHLQSEMLGNVRAIAAKGAPSSPSPPTPSPETPEG